MSRTELSIRMEGRLERLLALRDRYAEAAIALESLEQAEVAILRSRMDALISEETAHQELWASLDRLQPLATSSERSQLQAVRAGRARMERALTRLAPVSADADADLVTLWSGIGPRLHLFARLARARRDFKRGRLWIRLYLWGGGLFVGPLLLSSPTGLPLAWLSVVGWVLCLIGIVAGWFEKRPHCHYCGEEADWFDDLPRIRAELVRRLPDWPHHCGRCEMSRKNFDAAMVAVRSLDAREWQLPTEGARRRERW